MSFYDNQRLCQRFVFTGMTIYYLFRRETT